MNRDEHGCYGCLGLILTIAWIWGVIYAFRVGNPCSGMLAVAFPPYGWYLAYVSFTDKDEEKNIDWDQRVRDEVRMCVSLISQYVREENDTVEVSEKIDNIAKRINKYPNEKKLAIERGVLSFHKLINALADSVDTKITEFYQQGEWNANMTQEVEQAIKECESFLQKEEIELFKREYENSFRMLIRNIDKTLLSKDAVLEEVRRRKETSRQIWNERFDYQFRRLFGHGYKDSPFYKSAGRD